MSVISQGAMEGLMQLVKVNIRPRDLPEFFWHHLERDIELLGRSIGRSMDESAITIHLVLKDDPSCRRSHSQTVIFGIKSKGEEIPS